MDHLVLNIELCSLLTDAYKHQLFIRTLIKNVMHSVYARKGKFIDVTQSSINLQNTLQSDLGKDLHAPTSKDSDEKDRSINDRTNACSSFLSLLVNIINEMNQEFNLPTPFELSASTSTTNVNEDINPVRDQIDRNENYCRRTLYHKQSVSLFDSLSDFAVYESVVEFVGSKLLNAGKGLTHGSPLFLKWEKFVASVLLSLTFDRDVLIADVGVEGLCWPQFTATDGIQYSSDNDIANISKLNTSKLLPSSLSLFTSQSSVFSTKDMTLTEVRTSDDNSNSLCNSFKSLVANNDNTKNEIWNIDNKDVAFYLARLEKCSKMKVVSTSSAQIGSAPVSDRVPNWQHVSALAEKSDFIQDLDGFEKMIQRLSTEGCQEVAVSTQSRWFRSYKPTLAYVILSTSTQCFVVDIQKVSLNEARFIQACKMLNENVFNNESITKIL
jgi:hypothetical protein